MAGLNTLFRDPRRRNLAILALLAAASVILAVIALDVRQNEVAPHYTQEPFFPGLADRLNEIARIRITSRKGTFDVAFKPYKSWVLPSRNDYPASFDMRKDTIVGMKALVTLEPKTARADWLHYVDLDAPPKGNGVMISLLNDKGETIASMIVGASIDIGDPTGDVGIFVRKPGSTQAWLVKSPVEFKTDPSDWLEKNVMTIDGGSIQETDVDPVGSASYEARRENPNGRDFVVTDMPAGRELTDPAAADAVATAAASFTFQDVRPARDLDFGDAARVITKTSDGLTVTIETLKQGDEYWATVAADSAPGKPDAAKQARDINGRVNGWAFELPPAEGQLLMTPLDSLLKPPGGAKPTATP
jgi:hypothetical protein